MVRGEEELLPKLLTTEREPLTSSKSPLANPHTRISSLLECNRVGVKFQFFFF